MKKYYKLIKKNQAQIIDTLVGYKEGDWVYCIHCKRVYKVGEFREIKEGGEIYQMCPYPDCGGSAVLDAWPWEGKKEPERNKIYAYSIG